MKKIQGRMDVCFRGLERTIKLAKIESVKTNELDKNKYDSDKEDNFTSLKQLIVDIQNQDNEEYYDIKYTKGKPWGSSNDYF